MKIREILEILMKLQYCKKHLQYLNYNVSISLIHYFIHTHTPLIFDVPIYAELCIIFNFN